MCYHQDLIWSKTFKTGFTFEFFKRNKNKTPLFNHPHIPPSMPLGKASRDRSTRSTRSPRKKPLSKEAQEALAKLSEEKRKKRKKVNPEEEEQQQTATMASKKTNRKLDVSALDDDEPLVLPLKKADL
jgi:hypothetical protein